MRCLPTGAATFVVGVVAVVGVVVGGGGVVSLFAERAHNVRRPTRTASRTTLRVGRIVLDKTARPDSRTRRIVFFSCARVCVRRRVRFLLPSMRSLSFVFVFVFQSIFNDRQWRAEKRPRQSTMADDTRVNDPPAASTVAVAGRIPSVCVRFKTKTK